MNILHDPWTYVLAVPVVIGIAFSGWIAVVGTR